MEFSIASLVSLFDQQEDVQRFLSQFNSFSTFSCGNLHGSASSFLVASLVGSHRNGSFLMTAPVPILERLEFDLNVLLPSLTPLSLFRWVEDPPRMGESQRETSNDKGKDGFPPVEREIATDGGKFSVKWTGFLHKLHLLDSRLRGNDNKDRRKDREKEGYILLATPEHLHLSLPDISQWANLPSLTLECGRSFPREAFLSLLNQYGFQRVSCVETPHQYALRGEVLDVFHPGYERPFRLNVVFDQVHSIHFFDVDYQESLEEVSPLTLTFFPVEALQGHEARRPLYEMLPQDMVHLTFSGDRGQGVEESGSPEVGGNGEETPRFSKTIFLSEGPVSEKPDPEVFAVNFSIGSLARFERGSWEAAREELRQALQDRKTLYGLVEHELEKKPVRRLLGSLPSARFHFLRGKIAKGFELLIPRCLILNVSDLFHKIRFLEKTSPHEKQVEPLDTFFDLSIGDFVVHLDYGIGKFMGLTMQDFHGRRTEVAHLVYKNDAVVYVPVSEIHLIFRYLAFGRAPELDDIHSSLWSTRKRKAQEAITTFSYELLRTQALRETLPGFSFQKDSEWQEELELSFPYPETPDQRAALNEVKRDMESPTAMDRLLCGDVGFGKTEIALRAAFKACLSGKQVVLLCPTTVLAEQHYTVFQERLKPFPISIDMLSRFRSRAEQKEILQRLRGGELDIMIGTHRLLQKDVAIPHLGLLIIDEEQRFGVEDKERIKQVTSNLDVLTLTATPIPRTLHQALTGSKKISVLQTPPLGRQSIATHLVRFDPSLIQKKIRFELERGGQVFFVNDTVQDLERYARGLQRLLPDVRLSVLHGQLPEHLLEERMRDFYHRRYDVLMTTTLIESGLDLPNVNTLFINNAHHFGLSELHQLRGRVGRSPQKAYCYLLIPESLTLDEPVLKRLRLLEEYSGLGAGFKIASRDLEIRGAGNLLGKEQHGHIVSMGYELYTRLLNQSIQRLKKKKSFPEFPLEPTVVLEEDMVIPRDYIPDDSQRLYRYKKILQSSSLQALEETLQECRNIHGPLPSPMQGLIRIAQLKILCRAFRIYHLRQQGDKLYGKYIGAGARIKRLKTFPSLVWNPNNSFVFRSRRGPCIEEWITALKRLRVKSSGGEF